MLEALPSLPHPLILAVPSHKALVRERQKPTHLAVVLEKSGLRLHFLLSSPFQNLQVRATGRS